MPAALPHDRTDLVIIDTCDRPGEACDEIEGFRRDHPLARIVVLANHCASGDIVPLLNAGDTGYFATIATRDDFIKSLELVMGGQIILPSEGLSSVLVREAAGARDVAAQPDSGPIEAPAPIGVADVPQFSPRELYILRCLTEGSSNKAIAREYDIAEGTVKVHVRGDPAQDQGEESDPGGDLGTEQSGALVLPQGERPCGKAAPQPDIDVALAGPAINAAPSASVAEQASRTAKANLTKSDASRAQMSRRRQAERMVRGYSRRPGAAISVSRAAVRQLNALARLTSLSLLFAAAALTSPVYGDAAQDNLATARTIFPPTMPQPNYLQPAVDPVFQTPFTRVTDPGNGGTGGVACDRCILHAPLFKRAGVECGPKPVAHHQRMQWLVLPGRSNLSAAVPAPLPKCV